MALINKRPTTVDILDGAQVPRLDVLVVHIGDNAHNAPRGPGLM